MQQSYRKFSSTSYVQGCAKVKDDCCGIDLYHVKDMFTWIQLLKIYEYMDNNVYFIFIKMVISTLSTESELLR